MIVIDRSFSPFEFEDEAAVAVETVGGD